MGYITGVRNGATEINLSISELKAVQKKMVEIDNELDKIRSETPLKGVLSYNKKQVDSLVRENELLRKQRLWSSKSQQELETANHGLQNQIKNLKSSSSVKKRIQNTTCFGDKIPFVGTDSRSLGESSKNKLTPIRFAFGGTCYTK